MKKYCLALDLKNDEALIKEYEEHHKNVWKEILEGIKTVGIIDMQIYRIENRMFMIIETESDFDFDKQMEILSQLPRQQEWEKLMWKFQQSLPNSAPNSKWQLMNKVFQL
ncbi:MAG: L-rhamnose mutarotase [Cytophagales bacterium]|nr:MAG: L-rhamnose mutarotase [Cytophagales bacterium]